MVQFFFSTDGQFGLCRKKSSGISVYPPLSRHCFTSKMKLTIYSNIVGCLGMRSAFFAGDALRTMNLYKGLDETVLVGVSP